MRGRTRSTRAPAFQSDLPFRDQETSPPESPETNPTPPASPPPTNPLAGRILSGTTGLVPQDAARMQTGNSTPADRHAAIASRVNLSAWRNLLDVLRGLANEAATLPQELPEAAATSSADPRSTRRSGATDHPLGNSYPSRQTEPAR